MKLHDLQQGSPAWHEFRGNHFGASEAAAMLGMSPTTTRAELLRMKYTTLGKEFAPWVQENVLDEGHRVEAQIRGWIADEVVNDELYPATCSDGLLSASCDGLTLLADVAWENKQWNEAKAAIVRAGGVPDEHVPQCQQVLMVTGASKLIFSISDGTPERTVWVVVYPSPEWFQRLRDGWALFQRDLAAYTLPPAAEAAPVGKAPDQLPALRIEVTGQVTASNLAEFKQTALAAIRSVNRDLKTDSDFADAEKAVKWCDDVETRLKAAKEHALSQTASIDALFKTIDDIAAESKRVRLDLDKLVTRRKAEVKDEAVVKARAELDARIGRLNAELAPFRILPINADFAGAIKGKRTLTSVQEALDGVLVVATIAAENEARAVRANLTWFKVRASDFEFLFADLGQIVHKQDEDFRLAVDARISTHIQAEARKEAERQSAEAQRVAQAEQRAREQEAARIAAQQAEAARVAAAAAQAAATVAEPVITPAVAPMHAPALQPERKVILVRGDTVKPANFEPATLNLGAICGRLQFTVSAAFLCDVLHIQPAKTYKASKLYTESQFAAICSQLLSHVSAMAELYAGEVAC